MKQSSTPKKAIASRPLNKQGLKKLLTYTVLLTVVAPLIDCLLLFPLQQIVLANSSGSGVVYQIVSLLTELFNLFALFLLLALIAYTAAAGASQLVGRAIALHGIASVFIVILLRMGVYYLLAWMDYHFYLPFALCNKTLNALTQDSGAEMMALTLSLFLSQVILFVLLGIIALLALKKHQTALSLKQDLSPQALAEGFDSSPLPRLLKWALILYIAEAGITELINTVLALVNLGVPNTFDSLMQLIVPYFYLAIYCVLGYLTLDYGARYIARSVRDCTDN